jgi:hypothetical protein
MALASSILTMVVIWAKAPEVKKSTFKSPDLKDRGNQFANTTATPVYIKLSQALSQFYHTSQEIFYTRRPMFLFVQQLRVMRMFCC